MKQANIEKLAGLGVLKQYRSQTIIVNEGDYNDSVFVIREGQVKVYKGDLDGERTVLGLCGAGEYVGELAVFSAGPRDASIITTTRTKCALVQGEQLRVLIASDAEFALDLIGDLASRVRLMSNLVSSMCMGTVYERVVSLLWQSATGEPADPEGRRLPPELTQGEVAERVNCTREMVNRIYRELKRGGHIAVDARRVRLISVPPLKW